MPRKQLIITVTGPWPVVPSLVAQGEIRNVLIEEIRRSGEEIDYVALKEVMERECSPREGFLVTQTQNTLEVDPGAIISRRRVLELVSDPSFVVDIKGSEASPYDRRGIYVHSRSVFLTLDPLPEA